MERLPIVASPKFASHSQEVWTGLKIMAPFLMLQLIGLLLLRTSWEASEEWTLVILFCRRHQLPLSEVYLIQCASDNQWLHFTCFVQAHQYPKEQVLDLLKKFSSITVREHLHDAFRNLHFGPALIRDDLQGVRQRPLSSQRVRDVKAHYYHRVGFLRRRSESRNVAWKNIKFCCFVKGCFLSSLFCIIWNHKITNHLLTQNLKIMWWPLDQNSNLGLFTHST